jgi:thiosulfate/3-mercaptopyruvate sulfurtransferase
MSLPPLVSVRELADRIDAGDVRVVDCRFDLADPGKGERDWLAGHIPGAAYAHLDRDLSDLSRAGEGRHPLPGDDRISALLSRLGWPAGLAVVAYDDAGGALAAARLWWLLRLAGLGDVGVLDGGLAAWKGAGLPLESGPVQHERRAVQARLQRDQVVGYGELAQRLAAGEVLLLDARAAPRYRGDVEPIDRVGGHVPGAVNRPFSHNLDASGQFKPPAELRREFDALLGGRPPSMVAQMCGSGVTACHNLLAMEHAGLAGSRVFAPSWSGWIGDPARPVATGGQDGG